MDWAPFLLCGCNLRFVLDGQQIHFEDKRSIWPDAAHDFLSVGKLRGDEELPLGAHGHRASDHPLISPLTGKVAGWLRL